MFGHRIISAPSILFCSKWYWVITLLPDTIQKNTSYFIPVSGKDKVYHISAHVARIANHVLGLIRPTKS